LRGAVCKLHLDVDAVARHPGGGHSRAGVAGDALLTERLLELGRYRLVLDRHETRQQLDDRDVAAEAREDRGEFHADCAASHDHQGFRHVAKLNRFIARDDAAAIDLYTRHAARGRAGRDDDLLARAQGLLLAFEDIDATVAGQTGGSFDPVDFVFLEEELNAFRQTADDTILPRLHLAHVDADWTRRQGDAPVFGMLGDLQRVR